MTPELNTEVVRRLNGILLLNKPENRTSNLMAVFGLFPTDFAIQDPALVSYDATGILVEADAFKGLCTCADDPKSPRVYRIAGDPERHNGRCDAYKAYAIAMNPWLVDVEHIEKDGRPRSVFSFQWPRELTSHERDVLVTRFTELQADSLWGGFLKGWNEIMALLPEPVASYASKLEAEEDGPAPDPETGTPTPEATGAQASEGMDFGDMDITFSDDPKGESAAPPATEKPLEEVIQETAAARKGRGKKKEKAPEEPQPAQTAVGTEEPASLVSPGGTVITLLPQDPGPTAHPATDAPDKKADAGAKEKKEDGKKKDEKPKKINPAVRKFVEVAREEISGILTSLDFLMDTEGFPVDSLKMLKSRFDRMGIKTAHLVFRGGHELERPGAINPLIEITLANVNGKVGAAIRDLGLSPEKPNSWVDFRKELKEAADISESMSDIMAQMGVSEAIQEPPKLKDKEGKALVD